MKTVNEFSEVIDNSYKDLSPNFLIIADFILANPEDVALLSMRNIADQIGLDPSNFVRFAKHFSFSGYPELRAVFQSDLRQSRVDFLHRAERLQNRSAEDRETGLLEDLQNANTSSLDYVFEHNSPEALGQAADTLLSAKRIFIMGLRSCFPAAFSLHYTCRMIRDNVNLSSGHGGTFADDIRGIGADDVFVVVGTHPYTANTVLVAEYAAENGAHIIALTDSAQSPLARLSHSAFTFERKGRLVPGTIVPIIALVEAITAVMIANGGERALKAIKDSEEQLHQFSAYLKNARGVRSNMP